VRKISSHRESILPARSESLYRLSYPGRQQLNAHLRHTDREPSDAVQRKSITRVTLNGVTEERHSVLLGLRCRAYCTDLQLQISLHWPDGTTVCFRYVGGSTTATSAALGDIEVVTTMLLTIHVFWDSPPPPPPPKKNVGGEGNTLFQKWK